jgi:Lrp/AsnC family leucine-responsive transcriptional regulator
MKINDLRILKHLRHNARMNLTTISRKTGIPVSTIFDKLRGYETDVVVRFTTIVDFAKLGYPVRANIFLKVDPACRDAIKTYLLAHDRVNNLFRINNGYDYAAECLFSSIKEVEEFVETLEEQFKIVDKTVFHVIDDLAREKALSVME